MRSLVAWLTAEAKPDSFPLRLARGSWIVVVVVVTALFVVAIPATWNEATSHGLFVEYFGASGHYRLTAPQIAALSDVGLTASWHGALVVARQVVLFGGSVLVSWLVWRADRGWAALFVSLFLVGIIPITLTEVTETGGGFAVAIVFAVFSTSFVGMLFVLPDGRRIRLFAVTVLAWVVAYLLGIMFVGSDAFWEVGMTGILVGIGLGMVIAVSQAIRAKDPTRRAVLGLAGAFTIIFIPLMFLDDQLSGVTMARRAGGELVQRIVAETVLFSLPLVFGVGVVYLIVSRGMWDIDIALNRTVVYGALTTVLFTAYFILVAVVQAISSETFGIRDNTLALVVATAAGAALFMPLRERVQSIVDRVFFRKRYDIERTVDELESRVRSRDRLDEIAGDLVMAADDAFQPIAAELWLPVSTAGGHS